MRDCADYAGALEEYQGKILAVITTVSCFAPRVPDKVDKVAKFCQDADVYHIINSAYGLQCAVTSKLINRACVIGRVDAIICSTDKNFLVPVGTCLLVAVTGWISTLFVLTTCLNANPFASTFV
jgi:O-phospho-L-seryl-tRNASec:L-selenocysteinyl-tRNA synthase